MYVHSCGRFIIILSPETDAVDEVTVYGCKNGSCLQDYDYCERKYCKMCNFCGCAL